MSEVKMKWDCSTTPGRLKFRMSKGQPWIDYKQSPYYVADYGIPNGSLGYATMQKALKVGVTYYTPGDEASEKAMGQQCFLDVHTI